MSEMETRYPNLRGDDPDLAKRTVPNPGRYSVTLLTSVDMDWGRDGMEAKWKTLALVTLR
jgi:hypothetical protein